MNHQTAIKSAQLKQLFSASKLAMTTSTLLAVILAYIEWGAIKPQIILPWLSLIVIVTFSRFILTLSYQRLSVTDRNEVNAWFLRFRIGVLGVGILWGTAGYFMFTPQDLQHQMFLIFMLAGLTAGGVVSFSPDLICSNLFSLSVLFPITARFIALGDKLSIAMGMASLLYLAYLLVSARNINQKVTENIVLQLEAITREEVVRASEEHYRLLLKHSPVGIFHYDTNLVITYCNERLTNILQNSVTSIVGLGINNLMDSAILAASQKSLEGEIIQYQGKLSPSAGNNELWIEMTCAPSRDAGGKILGGIAIVRDVTENKLAEEMLRINAIAFETQLAMIVTTPKFVILRVNRAFTELTGYTQQEVIGKTPRMLNSGRHDRTFFQGIKQNLKMTGNWQGEIWNRRKNGMIDAEWVTISAVTTDEGKITHFVGTFSDITENKDAVAEIHRLAYYDPLTHLPNRRLLQDRLEQELAASIRNGLHGAILFLDLDNFKSLNDTRGHDAGDQLLIEVANRLLAEIREGDVVGRLGGDEFVVLLENLSAEPDEAALAAKEIGERFLTILSRPYFVDGYEFHCSTSIGIRLFREQETVEELLRHADLAMYQAKLSGRNTLRFFDPDMQTIVTNRVDMEKDLRNALEKDQFMLYYQAQVSQDRRIIGAEALLCWQHPKRGLVLPGEFIQLAEKSNLIHLIGLWVLESACAQLKVWQSDLTTQHLQLAVNVSARQFRHVDFVSQVRQTLTSYEVKPNLLKLELTESTVLDNIDATVAKMNELKTLGVSFSLDDFGTGYSSFSNLTQLPFDQLKIDRSFIHNVRAKTRDGIIVKTIIGMARNLGIEVVAEGVETESQYAFLEQFGCPVYQGYLFSRPLSIQKFEQLLAVESLPQSKARR